MAVKRNGNTALNQVEVSELQTCGNKLIGWLVSFDDDDSGSAIELRSKRILFSKSKIFENSIQLVAEDISTPHAALKTSPDGSVLLQDIFSVHGTFITKYQSSEETRVDGPVDLGHGDRIRFGKTSSFQVCLIHDSSNEN